MDRYAVIGHPVAHSKSPLIHAAFARQTGQSLSYEAIDVAPDALEASLAALAAQGFLGLNVTLPHKVEVMRLCEAVSDRARRAGAVNTLLRTDGGWSGDNTDGEGCLRDLQRLGFGLRDRRVLVLGAGGAVRGILEPLLREQPAELVVSNRSPAKPEALAEDFRAIGPIRPCTHQALKGDRFDLIIHGTSAGHDGSFPRLPGQLLTAGGQCYDLSYGRAFAPFRAWAESQGAAQISDGLGMLVEQAAASFERWLGMRPDTAPVIAQLRETA